MVRTKFVLLAVTCDGCCEDLPFFGIKNYDNLTCDICGKVKPKVTYRAKEVIEAYGEKKVIRQAGD